MRTLLYLLQKEFTQILRNKAMLRIMILIPIVQLLVLVHAASFEVKHVDIAVVDQDHSSSSSRLINQIANNPIFRIQHIAGSYDEAEDLIRRNEIDLALCIPTDFEKKIVSGTKPDIQILADAIVGNAAQLGTAYLSSIIMDFNKRILIEKNGAIMSVNQINVINSFWFNPDLNYKIYMAPGIMVVLITIIAMLLGAANLVREKELGTIEQINVTPIQRWELLAGKLIPFLIIGLLELSFGLILAHLLFSMPFQGSILLLYFSASVYLVLVLSVGLFVSTVSDTQQQVAFVGFFLMMVFVMLSGLFTPTESMPIWAQYLDRINPLYYFVRIMRGVILKGAHFLDITSDLFSMTVFAGIMFTLAVQKYRKTT